MKQDEKPEVKLILTKFGKTSLEEILELIEAGNLDEVARKVLHRPPVWRREEICSDEQIANAERYTKFVEELSDNIQLKGL